ncbi:MAG: O-antigen ligase family protein [Anaerolineaceae bacterium]|nr:O-antigen ligase family protein [Anaerolineaceae bacterium]
MTSHRLKLLKWIWIFLVVLLPVTSFPLIVKIVGSDVVGLPSGILLLAMVLLWLLPRMVKGDGIPESGEGLLVFILLVLISSAASFFKLIPPYKDQSMIREMFQSILTLGIGTMMFFVVSSWTQRAGQLQLTLRLLNFSGFFVLLWSVAQAVAWKSLQGYPAWMELFHRFFSTGVLYKARVCGLALEPSWMAHQLNMLYLPLWFSATLNRYSVHRRRILGVSFENFLFVLGVGVLFLTFSRVGYASFFMMVALFFLRWNHQVINTIYSWLVGRLDVFKRDTTSSLKKRLIVRRSIYVGLTVGLILIYLGLMAGAVYGISRVDDRMGSLLDFNLTQEDALLRYVGELEMGPRVAFWAAGWEVFNDYPVIGVGLGNSGFFFNQKLAAYSWIYPEVRDLMWRGSAVLNPKNLWVRLLAEVGIIGMIAFVLWLFAQWRAAKKLVTKSSSMLRFIGLGGMFTLFALVMEGFSVDSFALPYLWFTLGLVNSAYHQSLPASESQRDESAG